MLKSAQGYVCLCVCKILNKTLLCFNRILNFVVNIRETGRLMNRKILKGLTQNVAQRNKEMKYGRERNMMKDRRKRFKAQ